MREDCKISVLLPQGAPPSSDQSAGLTSRSSHLVDGDGYRAAYGRRLDAGVEHGVVVVAEVHGEPHGERVVEASLALCADTQPQDITILSRHRWWLRMSPKPMQAFRKCDIMTPLGLPARSHELRTSAPFPWSARLQGSPASIAATPRCRPTHLSEATCLLPAGERLYTSRPDLSLVNSCQNERLAKGTHWLAVQENPHKTKDDCRY